MRELVHPRWPSDRPTNVHWIQARKAFGPEGEAYPGRMVAVVDGTVLIERVPERTTAALVIALPERLAALLERGDLTTLSGAPLALVSEAYEVLGVATGPTAPPTQLRVQSNVSRLEAGETVELPAVSDEQPSLQLLAAFRVQDERGCGDA